jgi:predicted nucleic acid-binding protein
MPYLIDTCALSEMVQAKPNPKVTGYLAALPNLESFISAMSIGEILYGIELLPPSAKRKRLEGWYADWVLPHFRGRILPNDLAVMERWGPLVAALEHRGLKMPLKDSLIAACALAADLTVITRNEGDFSHCGVAVINPWTP